ncbi:MAG: NAD(P)H-binding protein [Gemmatimonadaceae bacterium]
MILVVGGSGVLGQALVERLIARGERVRVMTRTPKRLVAAWSSQVEVVAGDLRQPYTVQAAIDGCTTVVAAAHGFGAPDVSPATVDHAGNITLIDAAQRVNADVVLMSIVGASTENTVDLFRAKAAAEAYLQAANVPYSILRCTAFMETWSDILGAPLRQGGNALVFDKGQNLINFVSVIDVAALLTRVVCDRSLRGETLEFGGVTDYTLSAFAALLGTTTGSSRAPRHIPRPALRALSLLLRPFKPDFARQAGAALAMDTTDMRFDSRAVRARFAEVSNTSLDAVVAEWAGTPLTR